MAIAPPGLVVPPPKLPGKLKYGLLDTVEPITLDEPHAWASGVEWEFDLCTTVESFTDHCPPATAHVKSTERDLEFCHADPFIIKSSFECSTGGRPVSEAFGIARRRLLAWEEHELERVFWTGQVANGLINPSLANGNDTCDIVPDILSPLGPLTIVAAIAVLEESLSDIVPGGGIIHVPFGLAAYLTEHHLVKEKGNKLFSPAGFPVVLGAGYPGSGPGGLPAAPGSTWIFGTGPVGVWRSELFMNPREISEGIDRLRNNVTVYAERFYIVGYTCTVCAVNVCL